MSINLHDTGVDPQDPSYAPLFDNLQGNIVKPHGREHAVLLLLQLASDPQAVGDWLQRLVATGLVTSASRQLEQTRAWHEGRGAGETFGSLLLSAQGYRTLGVPQVTLDRLFPDAAAPKGFPVTPFSRGMATAGHELADAPRSQWEAPYQQRIDAMLLLADDDPGRLSDVRAQAVAGMAGAAEVLAVETGRTLRNAEGEPIEHFGYADGISQPLFLSPDLVQARAHNGTSSWDPAAPLDLVLLADPLAPAPDSFGSYLVFRKLEQDVEGFQKAKRELASMLANGGGPALAGAFAVGRFEDGTPVALSAQPASKATNNFDYVADAKGTRCPFHAHIRKTNPRGGTVASQGATFADERTHRIARRGIPYGGAENGGARAGKGLLFMCYQREISLQFGFIQKLWANNPGFPNPDTALDPVIGEPANGHVPRQSWPAKWGAPATSVSFDLRGFVSLKGGEFFFAPSIPFLRNASASLRAAAAL
jgi:Dyp-type peroxidase family